MKAVVHQRIDANVKADAVAILHNLGLKEADGINLLYGNHLMGSRKLHALVLSSLLMRIKS